MRDWGQKLLFCAYIPTKVVVREYHQAVVLVPVHLTSSVRRVVRYQCQITVGIIGVMVVTNLRWSGGMIAILVLIREVVRLCCLCGVHLLHLGKRFAHASKSHLHAVTCLLGLTTGIYQTV